MNTLLTAFGIAFIVVATALRFFKRSSEIRSSRTLPKVLPQLPSYCSQKETDCDVVHNTYPERTVSGAGLVSNSKS